MCDDAHLSGTRSESRRILADGNKSQPEHLWCGTTRVPSRVLSPLAATKGTRPADGRRLVSGSRPLSCIPSDTRAEFRRQAVLLTGRKLLSLKCTTRRTTLQSRATHEQPVHRNLSWNLCSRSATPCTRHSRKDTKLCNSDHFPEARQSRRGSSPTVHGCSRRSWAVQGDFGQSTRRPGSAGADDSNGSSTILLRQVSSGRRFDVMAEKPLTGRGQRPAPHELPRDLKRRKGN